MSGKGSGIRERWEKVTGEERRARKGEKVQASKQAMRGGGDWGREEETCMANCPSPAHIRMIHIERFE